MTALAYDAKRFPGEGCRSVPFRLILITQNHGSEFVAEVDFSIAAGHLDRDHRAPPLFPEERIDRLQQPAFPPRRHHVRDFGFGLDLALQIDDPAREPVRAT